jgi:TPP-dependent trihydroxycyclohexane-1,2-dione (THcHDO) dehydratase
MADLSDFTSLHVGGPARDFIEVATEAEIIAALEAAGDSPILILGGGIRMSRSINELEKFLKKIDLPIVTTWSGLDTMDYKDKNYIGCLGVYGSRAANFAVQNSDLILNFGSRLDTRITGGKPETFARSAKVVSIDVDMHELNKKRGLEVHLNSVAPSGSNYVNRYFEGNIQNPATSNSNTNAFYSLQGNNSFTASTFGNCVVYIPNYTQTTSHKTLLTVSTTENNANVVDMGMNAGTFLSNNAITSLLLEPDGASTLAEFTTATLYGIKSS